MKKHSYIVDLKLVYYDSFFEVDLLAKFHIKGYFKTLLISYL